MKRYLIQNGLVVSEHETTRQDILISGETVAAVGEGLKDAEAEVIDASGCYVFPGMIDSHVHYFAPCADGYTIDDFVSGSIGALCGGVTTVVDYSFPRPGMDLRASLETRKREAMGYCYTDFTFHVELPGWYSYRTEELAALREQGINSLKLYTTYGDDRRSYEDIERLLEEARRFDLRVTVHAEDDEVCQRERQRLTQAGETGCAYHGKSRPAEAEVTAVRTLLKLAERTGGKLHIVHVSTGEAAGLIAVAKKRGVPVTCETCPHYLLLTEAAYQRPDGAVYIMTPPLRTAEDNRLLWEYVKSGMVNGIVSDHCAFAREDKLRAESCFSTLPGIPGTETIFPLLYTEGGRRGLRPEQIARIFSAEPARLFGLYPRKGCLRAGSDADLMIVDPAGRDTVTWKNLHSRSGYTVYEGWPTEGKLLTTMRRGAILVRDGRFVGKTPDGRFIPAV